MKTDTIDCYYISQQVHDKRGIEESLHVQIIRARLNACEVGIFSREISQLSKICPLPSFRSHLSSSPIGIFSRDYLYLLLYIVPHIVYNKINVREKPKNDNTNEASSIYTVLLQLPVELT